MDASRKMTGEEVVISGISGRFPKSDNIIEFMDNLYNKVDMVSSHFTDDHPELPKFVGTVSGKQKFDAQFFRVPYNQASSLDAMARQLMEQAYCINTSEFKNKKIGVYTGSSYQDYISTSLYEFSTVFKNSFIVSGSGKTMFSNLISFWCDGKGPSYNVDSSEASFTEALEKAYNDINCGIVDVAIVNGCAFCLLPKISLNMKRTGVLCLDGKTKCFDKKGDGYVRSEAAAVLCLQKAKDAKRIYAEIVHVKSCFGSPSDITERFQRKPEEIKCFLKDFYSEAKVNPNEIEYVEGEGTGLVEIDTNELRAIGDVFGKHKTVNVGCVKSNMGNSEPAAGICAVTKLCLAYQKGVLPANLHCDDPVEVDALENGHIHILTDNTPFGRGYTAVNNFSSTGLNCHILMKGYTKTKNPDRYRSRIPHLVCVSGRQDTSVDKIFNLLKKEELDPEVLGLLHHFHNTDIRGHTCRGYAIFDTDEKGQTVSLSQGSKLYQGGKRPLWFVYSGMGSQWTTMGAELMKIPVFAAAIEKCHSVLEPKGINLIEILTKPDKKVFDNILNCFVGITAVQIGLTDVLKSLDITPVNMIGHSVGEIGCAYCDGGLSAEDTILASYTRGLISVKSKFIKGSMAAVGLGFEELEPLCPPEIDIACHNSHESSTISGPTDVVKEFVKELEANNIFVREVPSGNIAYHSRYVKNAAPEFLRGLQEVIKKPAKRSEKWICTSLPEERWSEPLALYSSAEYHANNFTSPVYFQESIRKIPQDAILVEVAPHGLLQAILKRSHPNCSHIPLTRRGNSDPVKFFLEALGKLYEEGFNPRLDNLYPKIEFPVSTGTLPISHFIEWYHEENWPLLVNGTRSRIVRPCREITVSLDDPDYRFIKGHVREGNIVFPEAAILFALWETLAMYKGKECENMSVAFRDVCFHAEIILDKNITKINIDINKGNGYFEITHDTIIVANGTIYAMETLHIKPKEVSEFKTITSGDVYDLLTTKGYLYTNDFQSVLFTNSEMDTAKIKWNKNWTILIDSMIQMNLLARNHAGTSVPKMIKYLDISGQKISGFDNEYLVVYVQHILGLTTCAGIEMRELIFEDQPLRSKYSQVVQHISFIPHITDDPCSIEDALLLQLQIVAENIQQNIIIILDLTLGSKYNVPLVIDSISDHIPHVRFDVITMPSLNDFQDTNKTSHLVLVNNISHYEMKLEEFVCKNKFVLSMENSQEDLRNENLLVISTRKVNGTTVTLFKKNAKEDVDIEPVIYDDSFNWITRVCSELRISNRVVLVSEQKPQWGLKGLMKILKNQFGNKISFVSLGDQDGSKLIYKDTVYINQLKKCLFVNILKSGQWGGYYHLPCPKICTVPENLSLVIDGLGLIENLKWAEIRSGGDDSNTIQVYYAGLSVRDVEKATGSIKAEHDRFGMDFSGVNVKGQRLMGLVDGGAMASVVEPDPQLIWAIPDAWTLEEAATVPFPYIFAYYCLIFKWPHTMRECFKVIFITGGAGAFGQALISICLSMGCTVFTSVSSMIKKQYLMNRFPALNEKHICFSQRTGFHTTITEKTKGKMCDFVINTYTGKLRDNAMKCTGDLGIFVDVNLQDMQQNKPFGMSYLTEERSYTSAILSTIFEPQFCDEKVILRHLLIDGIARGVVQPISHVVFDTADVTKAFRLLLSPKRKGRFLIKIKDSSVTTTTFNFIQRMSCSSDGTYIIICDHTILGFELATRFVERGARQLIIHLNQEKVPMYLDIKLAQWRQRGVKVDMCFHDLQIRRNCENLLKNGKHLKVHGVFYIKPDAKAISRKEFVKHGNETTSIVNNLDYATRTHCVELKYFVVIASASNKLVDEFTASKVENILQSRSDIGLPALFFCFQTQYKPIIVSHLMDLQTSTITINALESSLLHNFDYVLTHNVSNNKTTAFLNSISGIMGVNINTVHENLKCGDLIYSITSLEQLKILIKHFTSVDFPIDKIKDFTFARLKTMNKEILKKTTKKCGLSAFYNYVEENEMETTNILIPMQTLVDRLVLDEYNLDSNGAYLLLIPGFEGNPKVFESLCERLKVRAVTCQLGPDMTTDSVPAIAFRIKEFLSKRFRMKSRFQLLGYSFGANVALEVAALLEKDGLRGRVYLLDSSPDALRVQMDAYIGNLTGEELQNAVIEHMFSLMSGQSSNTIKTELTDKNNWPEKVDLCLRKLRKHVSHSADYQRLVLESAYKRIILARNYEPNIKLESEIVLIKGIPHAKAKSLPNDYNLSKYTKRPLKVYDISSDLECAPEDCNVANIINQLTDPEFLEGLTSTNNCEVYLSEAVYID